MHGLPRSKIHELYRFCCSQRLFVGSAVVEGGVGEVLGGGGGVGLGWVGGWGGLRCILV